MAFKDFPEQQRGIELLQRSLGRERLGHAYLFTGNQLDELEALARTFAKALSCQHTAKSGFRRTDSCDRCPSCRKIDHGTHADVHCVRPESKLRIITIDQIRKLIKEIQLKPSEAQYKVAMVVAADRLRVEAANAFLKTLEEPPANSVLILLSTEPQRILDTILSRCLRLNFAGDGPKRLDLAQSQWLTTFSRMAASEQASLLGRYRLLDVLLRKLSEIKTGIEQTLTARSPLQHYKDVDQDYIEKWETELNAAIEGEYRRQRADVLIGLLCWLRDVWIRTLRAGCGKDEIGRAGQQDQTSAGPGQRPETPAQGERTADLLNFPEMAATELIAGRISSEDALRNLQTMEQLQRWLGTNVQEALALEVSLLKLRL